MKFKADIHYLTEHFDGSESNHYTEYRDKKKAFTKHAFNKFILQDLHGKLPDADISFIGFSRIDGAPMFEADIESISGIHDYLYNGVINGDTLPVLYCKSENYIPEVVFTLKDIKLMTSLSEMMVVQPLSNKESLRKISNMIIMNFEI